MKAFKLFFCVGFSLICSGELLSQDFTYTPKNPAFGGYYYNYSWLLNSAQVQDDTEDPSRSALTPGGSRRNALEDFEESLNRQILSQLSRSIVRNQFGEEALSEGSYNIGSYQLEVTEGLDGLNVIISDVTTGDQTTLFIPYY